MTRPGHLQLVPYKGLGSELLSPRSLYPFTWGEARWRCFRRPGVGLRPTLKRERLEGKWASWLHCSGTRLCSSPSQRAWKVWPRSRRSRPCPGANAGKLLEERLFLMFRPISGGQRKKAQEASLDTSLCGSEEGSCYD